MAIIDIDATGDLIVEVTEMIGEVVSDNQRNPTHQAAQFRVSKEVLKKSSQTLLKMLVDCRWIEGSQSLVSLGEGDINITEIWLRVIHKTKPVFGVALARLWFLVEAIDYYELDIHDFKGWFGTWCEKTNASKLEPRQLLYPTWRFDHAKGFAQYTRTLAYESTGHITEKNPTKLYQLHLPSRLMQQLNAAKGRLRTVLHRGLYKPCERLFDGKCACKKETLYDYEEHLKQIGVWPLYEVFMRTSMTKILERLKNFSFKARATACAFCGQNYKDVIDDVIARVGEYFDGLCLDCLDRSKPKTGDSHLDYWRHLKVKENEWVYGCRFIHRQPTWYFSFNGRQEDADRFRTKMTSRGRAVYGSFESSSEEDSD